MKSMGEDLLHGVLLWRYWVLFDVFTGYQFTPAVFPRDLLLFLIVAAVNLFLRVTKLLCCICNTLLGILHFNLSLPRKNRADSVWYFNVFCNEINNTLLFLRLYLFLASVFRSFLPPVFSWLFLHDRRGARCVLPGMFWLYSRLLLGLLAACVRHVWTCMVLVSSVELLNGMQWMVTFEQPILAVNFLHQRWHLKRGSFRVHILWWSSLQRFWRRLWLLLGVFRTQQDNC